MRTQKRYALAALAAFVSGLGYAETQLIRQSNPVMVGLQQSARVGTQRFAYGSAAFNALVNDSYRQIGGRLIPFLAWLETAYQRSNKAHLGKATTLEAALELRQKELAGAKGDVRVILERKTGAWLHKAIKAMIPKFSLDRGFEFAYTVQNGERQCLLQSVLIAALAQRMGLDAGVAMVWRNDKGQTSNLGHVTAILHLSSGYDTLIDASDSEPFFLHKGLLMRDQSAKDWRFLEPQYDKNGNIHMYQRTDGTRVAPRSIEPLSLAYIRSQFEFYRGERTVGGFIGPSTAIGLNNSALHLEKAVRLEPENPLALYVLALVERKQNKPYRARLEQAAALYQRYGFVPEGVKTALASP
jgi:hypothetical protein